MEDNKLDLFALVELFGHNRIAGRVTEQTVGSSTFVRIDVPDTTEQPKFTRFVNPSAIYAINPVSEDVANGLAESIKAKPINIWDAEEVLKRINERRKELAEARSDDGPDYDDNEDR